MEETGGGLKRSVHHEGTKDTKKGVVLDAELMVGRTESTVSEVGGSLAAFSASCLRVFVVN